MVVDQLTESTLRIIGLKGLHTTDELKLDLSCPLAFGVMFLELMGHQVGCVIPTSAQNTPVSEELL